MAKKFKSIHNKYKKENNKPLYKEFETSSRKLKEERLSYLEMISNKINIPSDILAGAPIINSVGRNQIYIENYKGIIEYSQSMVKIQTKHFKISIEGKRLKILYFTNDEIYITGLIHRIIYI